MPACDFNLRLLVAITSFSLLAASGPEDRAAQQAALAPYQPLVGQWKGTGQVRRGSTQGAWTEAVDWAWKFDGRTAALALTSANSKHVRAALLSADAKGIHLTLTDPEKHTRDYAGKNETDGRTTFTAAAKGDDALPDRVTLRFAAGGDRLVLVLEKSAGEDRYTPLGEIGYTRAGSGFGQGSIYPECVVTGGRGTIEVSHAGKTYYVCCTGCRDLFNADPEGVLKEFRERKEKEKAEKKK